MTDFMGVRSTGGQDTSPRHNLTAVSIFSRSSEVTTPTGSRSNRLWSIALSWWHRKSVGLLNPFVSVGSIFASVGKIRFPLQVDPGTTVTTRGLLLRSLMERTTTGRRLVFISRPTVGPRQTK